MDEVYGLAPNFGIPLSLYAVLVDGDPLTQTFVHLLFCTNLKIDPFLGGALADHRIESLIFQFWDPETVSVALTTSTKAMLARDVEVGQIWRLNVFRTLTRILLQTTTSMMEMSKLLESRHSELFTILLRMIPSRTTTLMLCKAAKGGYCEPANHV